MLNAKWPAGLESLVALKSKLGWIVIENTYSSPKPEINSFFLNCQSGDSLDSLNETLKQSHDFMKDYIVSNPMSLVKTSDVNQVSKVMYQNHALCFNPHHCVQKNLSSPNYIYYQLKKVLHRRENIYKCC